MNRSKILEALAPIQLAYTRDFSEESLKFYIEMLKDINPVTLAQAVINVIKQNEFIPTIAELREEAQLLSNYVNAVEEVPTAQMEWVKVLKAVSARGYEHGLSMLDGLTQKCAKVVWSSFDPRMGSEYNESSCRAQFIKAYEQEAAREAERLRLANSIKQNHLLMQARAKAQADKALIASGHKQIEMTSTGHLIEVPKREPVDVASVIEDSKISDEAKALLKGAIGL